MHMLAMFLQQDPPDAKMMQSIIAAAVGVYALAYLVQAVIFIIPTWFISKKAGFSPWLSMLCLFPLTGVVLLYILAFSEWKVAPAQSQIAWQPPPPPAPPQA